MVEPLGRDSLVYASCGGHELVAKAAGRTPPRRGGTVRLVAQPDAFHLFDAASETAIAR